MMSDQAYILISKFLGHLKSEIVWGLQLVDWLGVVE